MEVFAMGTVPGDEVGEWRRRLEPLRTLEDLLDWSRQLEPSVRTPEVVTQDEYTHDVLIPYAGGRWLDFDTT